jgi:hypothetical protein
MLPVCGRPLVDFQPKAALVDKKIKRASGRGAGEFPAEGLTLSLAILGP